MGGTNKVMRMLPWDRVTSTSNYSIGNIVTVVYGINPWVTVRCVKIKAMTYIKSLWYSRVIIWILCKLQRSRQRNVDMLCFWHVGKPDTIKTFAFVNSCRVKVYDRIEPRKGAPEEHIESFCCSEVVPLGIWAIRKFPPLLQFATIKYSGIGTKRVYLSNQKNMRGDEWNQWHTASLELLECGTSKWLVRIVPDD